MINKYIVSGYVTKEVDFSNVGEKYVANYTLKCPRTMQKGVYDYIPCVAWNKKAKNAAEYIRKGNIVTVCGRIETSYDVDKRSGLKVLSFKLVVDEQYFNSFTNTNDDYPLDSERLFKG